jgi:hypothetical protein
MQKIESEVVSVDFSGYSNFRHKSSNWNIFESGVKHLLTSNGQMMDQQFVYVVHNIKHIWVIFQYIVYWHDMCIYSSQNCLGNNIVVVLLVLINSFNINTTITFHFNWTWAVVYSIKHYVIKFVSDLRQVCGFLWVLQFPPQK